MPVSSGIGGGYRTVCSDKPMTFSFSFVFDRAEREVGGFSKRVKLVMLLSDDA